MSVHDHLPPDNDLYNIETQVHDDLFVRADNMLSRSINSVVDAIAPAPKVGFWQIFSHQYSFMDDQLSPDEYILLKTKLLYAKDGIDPIKLAKTVYLLLGATLTPADRQLKLVRVERKILIERSRYGEISRTAFHLGRNTIYASVRSGILSMAGALGGRWILSLFNMGITGNHLYRVLQSNTVVVK